MSCEGGVERYLKSVDGRVHLVQDAHERLDGQRQGLFHWFWLLDPRGPQCRADLLGQAGTVAAPAGT